MCLEADSECRNVLLDFSTQNEPEEDFVEVDIDDPGVEQRSTDENTEGLEPVELRSADASATMTIFNPPHCQDRRDGSSEQGQKS